MQYKYKSSMDPMINLDDHVYVCEFFIVHNTFEEGKSIFHFLL